eukprot:g18511.t1
MITYVKQKAKGAAKPLEPMKKGGAKSTKANHNKGLNLFDQFLLETNRNPLPPTKEDVAKEGYIAETEVCKVSMMQEFATFLFKYLQNDDEPLSFYRPVFLNHSRYRFAISFCSEVWIGEALPKPLLCAARSRERRGDKDGWYYDLRRVLNFKFMTRCFNLGLLAKEKAPGLTRSDNMNISRWLLFQARNAHVAEDAKTRNKYAGERRASELGQTQYQYVSFDTQFQCLAFDWAQDKVGKRT